jgi:hypothetical protein
VKQSHEIATGYALAMTFGRIATLPAALAMPKRDADKVGYPYGAFI